MKSNLFAVIVAALASQMAMAGPSFEFSQAKLSELKEKNSTYVIGLHSKYCGSCKVQKPAMSRLLEQMQHSHVFGLMADFDQEKALRKELKVTSPSTLILMRGTQELARVTGVTSEAALDKFLKEGA